MVVLQLRPSNSSIIPDRSTSNPTVVFTFLPSPCYVTSQYCLHYYVTCFPLIQSCETERWIADAHRMRNLCSHRAHKFMALHLYFFMTDCGMLTVNSAVAN